MWDQENSFSKLGRWPSKGMASVHSWSYIYEQKETAVYWNWFIKERILCGVLEQSRIMLIT